ncbi:Membrane protein [Limimaricola hongkongensis DSM 17492]|uniref:Membrane protein n=1 Tax=Limimaricola hongkongensis DSM 17492 TaxID=1122180 RepID=A0A017HBF3_9RHOB|nr:Membrane protein [Limimaricola hongkongensis DSM 17492]
MTATALPVMAPSPAAWSREIAAGETLDTVLMDAGLKAADRAEVALAIGVEYDLRKLRPGHVVSVITTDHGAPQRVTLEVDDGTRIETIFGDRLATRVVSPEPEVEIVAGQAEVVTSISSALAETGIPSRFAVDLAQILGGTVDFRRELSGGETLRLLWREMRVEDAVIGEPRLAFASLDVGDALYEVVWPDDESGRATIYLDGEVLRVFAPPVQGARLSSVFGKRTHPVYGNVRMHTGVDFAAARGTPVNATAPGRIAYVGWRGGYGRVVEIAHGSDTLTRYAHLSGVPDGLARGQRVAAGDTIGLVGATGTATGPNLHYEVRVNGRPTDPLSDERLAQATDQAADAREALTRLLDARSRLEARLSQEL